jgi:hypothetical protein
MFGPNDHFRATPFWTSDEITRAADKRWELSIPSKWLPIQLAPENCDLELGERSKVGIAPWSFPCRRTSEVWFNVWTNEPVLICPTHWRIWREPSRQ